MPDDDLPKSVWQGTFRVFGVDVHCHVLDNGERIIEQDSMLALLEAMGNADRDADQSELVEFLRWQRAR